MLGRIQRAVSRFFIPKVDDIISKPATTIREDETILDAVKLMDDKKIDSLVVTVGCKPAGIFTRNDLISILEKGDSLTETKVGDMISSPIVTVRKSDKVDSAVEVMREKQVTGVVVLSGPKIVGILTQTDIRLSKSQLSYRRVLKKYVADTFAYMVFWSGITFLIQVLLLGITIEKFVVSSLLGFVATILLAGIYGQFLDFVRNKFKV